MQSVSPKISNQKYISQNLHKNQIPAELNIMIHTGNISHTTEVVVLEANHQVTQRNEKIWQ